MMYVTSTTEGLPRLLTSSADAPGDEGAVVQFLRQVRNENFSPDDVAGPTRCADYLEGAATS
jgi:hypothetical protein